MALKELVLIWFMMAVIGQSGADIADNFQTASMMTLDPSFIIFTDIYLSWNDAASACGTSDLGRQLMTIRNQGELDILKLQISVNVSIWLGMVQVTDKAKSPLWISCEQYDSSKYSVSFEKPGNGRDPLKRCALLLTDFTWEWRDCSETHAFACRVEQSGGNFTILNEYFPKCGEATHKQRCPRFDARCAEDAQCIMAAEGYYHYLGEPYILFREVKLTWNDAVKACASMSHRLAVADRPGKRSVMRTESPVWIGLYSEIVGHPTPGMWINCEQNEEQAPFITQFHCAYLKSSVFSWSDCAQRRSFFCEVRMYTSGEEFKSSFHLDDLDEQEDLSSCPKTPCQPLVCQEQSHSVTQLTSDAEISKGFCVNNTETNVIGKTTASTGMTSEITSSSTRTTETVGSTPANTTSTGKLENVKMSTSTESEETLSTTMRSITTKLKNATKSTTMRALTSETPTDEPTSIAESVTGKSVIKEVDRFSCNTSCNCRCQCVKTVFVTHEEWQEVKESKSRWISSILDNLTIDKASLSSSRHRRTSAQDPRKSVIPLGSLGIATLCVVFMGIIILDISALSRDIRILIANLRLVIRR